MIDTTSHILPKSADLRPTLNTIENQGPAGTCTGQGAIKVLEVEAGRLHDHYPNNPIRQFSVLHNYYWSGDFEVRVGQEGRSPEDAFVALVIKGACPDELWPYDLTKIDIQPPAACDEAAKAFKIKSYTSLTAGRSAADWALAAEQTRINMKHAICQGRPVGVSIALTEDFRTQWAKQNNWRTFYWDAKPSATNPIIGSHEMVAMGYDDTVGRFLLQNSWDAQCDGGFCSLPYSLCADVYIGLQTAFCSVYDSIGHIPVEDYKPKQYDEARQTEIRAFMLAKFKEIEDARIMFKVDADEIDNAMKPRWAPGTYAGTLQPV